MAKREKILLVRLSAIGDVINCLPALRLLKRESPGARVTWAAEAPSASLLEGDRDIDEVFVVKRREWTTGLFDNGNLLSLVRAFRELRERRFDLAIDFQGNFRSGIVTFGSGARVRVGFTAGRVKEYSHVFYTKNVYLPKPPMHRTWRNLTLLEAIGIRRQVLPAGLEVGPGDGAAARAFIRESRIGTKDIVVLHPGVSEFGAFKQWQAEKFAELAKLLGKRRRTAVLVSWGPGERALAERVVRGSGGSVMMGPEPRGLRELAYLLSKTALFVGGDTGPLHIAAALGRPVVALFGPKDPAVYAPLGEGHVVVRKELECSPCQLRSCPDPRCMKLITVDDVYDACMSILG